MSEQKENDIWEGGEHVKNDEIGYTTILMYHLNRISQLMATLPGSEGSRAAEYSLARATLGLEQLLSPYLDQEYIKEKKELIKKEGEYELGKGIGDVNYAFKNLTILTKLMARKGLLLAVSGEEDIL